MKIIEKIEVVRYTVDKDQWDELVRKYGEKRAAHFLLSESYGWEFENAEEADELGLYMHITFNKETTPSIMSMS